MLDFNNHKYLCAYIMQFIIYHMILKIIISEIERYLKQTKTEVILSSTICFCNRYYTI